MTEKPPGTFQKHKILLGCTGSVATIKIPVLVEKLRHLGCDVVIVPTTSALHFLKSEAIDPFLSCETVRHLATKKHNLYYSCPCYTAAFYKTIYLDGESCSSSPSCHCSSNIIEYRLCTECETKALFPELDMRTDQEEWLAWKGRGDPVMHIELKKWADLLVIAPIDANTLAKIAHGICDNLLTLIARAWDVSKPALICPAMNTAMYEHPVTSQQISTLKSFGFVELEPIAKELICGDVGKGAMAEVDAIVAEIPRLLNKRRSPEDVNVSPYTYLAKGAPEIITFSNITDSHTVSEFGNVPGPSKQSPTINYKLNHLFEDILIPMSHTNAAAAEALIQGKKVPKKTLRKLHRQSGEEYIDSTGKVVPAKQFRDYDCKCRLSCNDKLSVIDREKIFKMYWNLRNWHAQTTFIVANVIQSPVKRRTTMNTASAKTLTRTYFLDNIKVCKTAFLNTLGISNKRLDYALRNKNNDGYVAPDMRGGHSHKRNQNAGTEIVGYGDFIDFLKEIKKPIDGITDPVNIHK